MFTTRFGVAAGELGGVLGDHPPPDRRLECLAERLDDPVAGAGWQRAHPRGDEPRVPLELGELDVTEAVGGVLQPLTQRPDRARLPADGVGVEVGVDKLGERHVRSAAEQPRADLLVEVAARLGLGGEARAGPAATVDLVPANPPTRGRAVCAAALLSRHDQTRVCRRLRHGGRPAMRRCPRDGSAGRWSSAGSPATLPRAIAEGRWRSTAPGARRHRGR